MPIPLEHGKYYHIYTRGNNRENIFIEERNYAYFLKLYARHIEPIADTFAYCLMRNHLHLLARIKDLTHRFPWEPVWRSTLASIPDAASLILLVFPAWAHCGQNGILPIRVIRGKSVCQVCLNDTASGPLTD